MGGINKHTPTVALPHRRFLRGDLEYEVVGTRVEGDHTIDTVKSISTGKYKEMNRTQTLKFMKS